MDTEKKIKIQKIDQAQTQIKMERMLQARVQTALRHNRLVFGKTDKDQAL